MAEEKKEKAKKERYEIVDVTTETAQMVKDNEDDTVYDQSAIIVRIANDIAEIKKNLG
jgi:hypothetical protein